MIRGMTAAILAGGASLRMGQDKALLPYRGRALIDHQVAVLRDLFPRVLVAGGGPIRARTDLEIVPDLLAERCVLAGIHAALSAAKTDHVFIVGCDMPHLHGRLIAELCGLRFGADVVIPVSESGPEPLHAVYARVCLPAIESAAARSDWKASSFHRDVRVRRVGILGADLPVDGRSPFTNANTPEEWRAVR